MVSAWKEEDDLVIEVKDNGVGIKEETIRKVFHEAEHLDEEATSIGLPATIRRVKLSSRDNVFRIDSEGEGTCIQIRFCPNQKESGDD